MTDLWKKSELRFTLLWIGAYMIGNSLSAGLFDAPHVKSCAVAVFHLGASLFLFFWIRKNGLMERYGLCKMKLPAGRFLWYIPLVILASRNLWNGVTAPASAVDTVFIVCSMIGAGFLEELLFRGFLFRAVSRVGVRRGIVISSVSFGLGHIANLFNRHEMRLAENIWQIIFATAFGFLCAILFYRGETLWPCIVTHAVFNATGVFAKKVEVTDSAQIHQNMAILLLVIGYAWFLSGTLPESSMDSKAEV